MPNAAAVVGLTYDSVDIQEDPIGIFLEVVRGLNELPKVRGVDTLVPARPYRIARNRVADELVIELRGYVAGVGADEDAQRADFRDLIISLRDETTGLFRPTRTPALLEATLENGAVVSVTCRPVNLVTVQRVPAMAAVSVELYAYEDWSSGGS